MVSGRLPFWLLGLTAHEPHTARGMSAHDLTCDALRWRC